MRPPISTKASPSVSVTLDAGTAIAPPICAIFRRALLEQGLKYTRERARVLDVLMLFREPFEGEELLRRLREPIASGGRGVRVSKATAYRTLKLLQDAGVVRRVLVGGATRFEVVDGLAGQGGLMLRTATGTRIVPAPEVEAAVRAACAKHGVVMRSWSAEVEGS